MMNTLTTATAHRELFRDVTPRNLTEEDALLWMVLLHTHQIHLRSDVLADGSAESQTGKTTVLPAVTQRVAADVIASLWPEQQDERSRYLYWYSLYNARVPYEVFSDVPPELRLRVSKFRDLIAQDPRVVAVVEED
jgi:hypothetical protein